MRHPSCDHPVANGSDDYSGVECCCCPGNRPCDAVTVEQMAAHRDFDLALFGEVAHVAPF